MTRSTPSSRSPRPAAAAALTTLALALTAAGCGTSGSPGAGPAEAGAPGTQAQAAAAATGPQSLGGTPVAGRPVVQRVQHDDVVMTVTVAPARPGPNLVRVDVAPAGAEQAGHDGHDAETSDEGHTHEDGAEHGHDAAADGAGEHADEPVLVGTPEDDEADTMVVAEPRAGTTGLWAVVDLPADSTFVLVSHGPEHRVPFAVTTGPAADATSASSSAAEAASTGAARGYAGPDGPECLVAATSAVLAGGDAPEVCPTDGLDAADGAALEALVASLADRGAEQLALQHDGSARSTRAVALVRAAARGAGLDVATATEEPARRSALLVLGGWRTATSSLRTTSALPLARQPIRDDGTWLAPWLLTPAVVDSTSGAVVPLDFDIRDEAAQEYSQTLAAYLPEQQPTSSGYAAWRAARGEERSPLTLYAASRAAYMPAEAGHAGHETQVAWFPGGTVTPVGPLP